MGEVRSPEDIIQRFEREAKIELFDAVVLIADWRQKKDALVPFARHAELMNREFADHDDGVIAAGFAEHPVTFGDFRRALAAYKE